MIEVLLGLPSKVKTLVDRFTAGRAANLDNLNATVSSRAAASTALTNVVWTDARAGKLDTAALEASPLLAPPIASGLIPSAPDSIKGLSSGALDATNGIGQFSTSSTSYVNAVSYTGKGVLELAGIYCFQSNVTPLGGQMVIVIDGVTVIDANSGVSTLSERVCSCLVGLATKISSTALVFSPSQIPFKTSLVIQIKTLTAANAVNAFYKYRKTA